jgi:hypothetical protein
MKLKEHLDAGVLTQEEFDASTGIASGQGGMAPVAPRP